jgi:ActR/RegA family two-component response regulator
MTGPGRILIVDDDARFVRTYRDILEQDGLAVTAAATADEALAALGQHGASLDVVLLDQKLQGGGGPDSGLELLPAVAQRAPFAKPIIVTGYATSAAVERAFAAGVYDYLIKNGAFEALLRAKVRNAVEATTAQRRAALRDAEVVGALRASWARVTGEADRNRKGKLLEELVQLLFRATPGFGQVTTRLDNGIEEIDVQIDNRSEDPLWRGEGPYLIAECKNWSSTCGTPELRNFRGKLTAKFQRVRVGFLIAPGGFSDRFGDDLRGHKQDELLVIPVDAADLARWIDADDRLAVLRALHERTVFDLRR